MIIFIIRIGTTIESVEIHAASIEILLFKLPTKYNYSTYIQIYGSFIYEDPIM